MKVKLIYAPGWQRYNTVLPIGITTLASYIRSHGYETSISDLELDTYVYNNRNGRPHLYIEKMCLNPDTRLDDISVRQKSILVELAKIDDADIIGISVMGRKQIIPSLIIAERAKELGKKVILGGEFVYNNSDYLWYYFSECVDFILYCDAWEPLRQLLDKLRNNEYNYENIPNLIYKSGDKIIKTNRVEFPIEKMPLPDYDGLNFEDYLYRQRKVYKSRGDFLIMQYIANLGCINNCAYCGRPKHHTFECKSSAKIVGEILEMSRKTGAIACKIEGNELNPTKKYINALADEFIKSSSNIKWSGYARLDDRIDYMTLKKMRTSGCLFIRWGVESGAQNFHNRMRKGYKIEQMESILNDAAKAGLFNLCIFMIGTPGETDDELEQTVEFIERNQSVIHAAKINHFTLTQFSDLYQCPEKFNITIDYKYPGGFIENDESDWYNKKREIIRRTNRLIAALVDAGIGQSGQSSDLVFNALLENNNDPEKAVAWIKESHPKLYEKIPHYMAAWYVYHREEKAVKGMQEYQYLKKYGD